MILLSLSDFIDGKYNLPSASSSISANDTEFQSYIDDNEKKYIYLLLGIELGDLLIAYIQASGTGNAAFEKIKNPFAEQNNIMFSNSNFIQSLGLKEYLKACIFYEYKKDMYTESISGTVKSSAEVSIDLSASAVLRKAERVFNSILGTVEAIQSVCEDTTIYPLYKGSRIAVKGHQFFL